VKGHGRLGVQKLEYSTEWDGNTGLRGILLGIRRAPLSQQVPCREKRQTPRNLGLEPDSSDITSLKRPVGQSASAATACCLSSAIGLGATLTHPYGGQFH
jgi:hypothetical protein